MTSCPGWTTRARRSGLAGSDPLPGHVPAGHRRPDRNVLDVRKNQRFAPPLPDDLSKTKLWLATYSTAFPQVPGPVHARWDFWQFTESLPAETLGFPADGERHVDMNYFNGSTETFLALCDPAKPELPLEQRSVRSSGRCQRPGWTWGRVASKYSNCRTCWSSSYS